MINFQPDLCLPKDAAGFGLWLTGHFYEHVVLRQKCAQLSTPQTVPDYDIFSWKDDPKLVQQWLVAHNQIHQAIREACNLTGSDLALVDLSKDDQFSEWQGTHAQEHQQMRQILGVS